MSSMLYTCAHAYMLRAMCAVMRMLDLTSVRFTHHVQRSIDLEQAESHTSQPFAAPGPRLGVGTSTRGRPVCEQHAQADVFVQSDRTSQHMWVLGDTVRRCTLRLTGQR